MDTRLPAVLALFGGVMWTIWPVGEALTHALSGQWQGGLGPTLTLVSVLGGTVVLALATITLVAAAQDVFSGLMATLIVLGALFSTLVAVPFVPAIVALPIASVLVVWQLSRVGALPIWLFRMHAAAPIVALVVFVIGLTGSLPGADSGPAGILLGLLLVGVLYLYPLSWLALGWSLLRRRPAARDGMAGVSAA